MISTYYFPNSEFIAEKRHEYQSEGLVYYTPFEELLNAFTHGIGFVLSIIGFIVMLIVSDGAIEYISACLIGLGYSMLFGCSTLYHSVKEVALKRKVRSIDHCSVNLVILSSGTGVIFLGPQNNWAYVAYGICFALVILATVLAIYDLPRFKKVTFILNFVIGIIIVVVYFVNRSISRYPWASTEYYIVGLVFAIISAALYGRKSLYLHSVFHVTTLLCLLFCYLAQLKLF